MKIHHCDLYIYCIKSQRQARAYPVAALLSFPLCNENLSSFLTRWETIQGEESIQGRKLYEEIRYVSLSKFMFSKQATKIDEIFTVDLRLVHIVKSMVKISSIFMTFLENMSFILPRQDKWHPGRAPLGLGDIWARPYPHHSMKQIQNWWEIGN